MPSERQPSEPDVRQRGKQGCVILAAGCAVMLMVCARGYRGPVAWRRAARVERPGRRVSDCRVCHGCPNLRSGGALHAAVR